MSADLKVSRDHLEEYSKNLEKLVAERTRELEEKTNTSRANKSRFN